MGPLNPLVTEEWLSLTEPCILLLIILHAVVLTVQAARSVALEKGQDPPQVRGYFQTWEDYTLFVLFVLFT